VVDASLFCLAVTSVGLAQLPTIAGITRTV